ncbi:S8/S53 family peptidase [Phytohabitans sp. ZYX-F-186]|uniref:S8/S53 family peptidase n=1 Tax=Phytohabitans maris TaxID=3071409 RepID=A0ABU0ZQI7_9ACTN|nr:S8/S53 family peptidase [Phytohabitans sp. ZYX-F-186]MDQ7909301.1 S8/S53 family peptidase [Phytohabitans sp. ZYX-F-186]
MADKPDDKSRSTEQIQADHAIRAMGGADEVGIVRSGQPAEIRYMYRKGCVLVREEALDDVRSIVDRYRRDLGAGRTETPAPRERDEVEQVVDGVRLLWARDLETHDVLDLIRDGHEEFDIPGLGAGLAAPDHLVHISGDAATCPATEPEPVGPGGAPYPPVSADPAAGAGVKVVVVDTGLDTGMASTPFWLHGVTGETDPLIGPGRVLDPYAGHGTFIAGLVRAVAPRAEVRVLSFFDRGGATWESTLVRNLDHALATEFPDVISMSAGTRSYPGGLLAFQVWNERRLRHHKGVALVVAAGNDGERQFFWPAAAPYTVSVGALDSDWRSRADYSNFGGWVDLYAPGTDLVNAFPDGKFTYQEPPNIPPTLPQPRVETFEGMAMWSGTSFATPIVAGLVAARMSRTGENARDAAAALLVEARAQAVPGVGAVLLP